MSHLIYRGIRKRIVARVCQYLIKISAFKCMCSTLPWEHTHVHIHAHVKARTLNSNHSRSDHAAFASPSFCWFLLLIKQINHL